MSNSTRRVYRFLAIGLAILIFLVLDFTVRRVYLALENKPRGRVAHPIYDHSLRPNTSWNDRYGTYTAPYFSNSLGFRDGRIREVSLFSDRPRVVLIGDSFTDGVGIPWEETFAGRLEKSLASEEIEVLNAGCNSYTPILERIKLRYWIQDRGLRVDRVILFLDFSDVKDELFYEEDEQGRARLIPYGPFASSSGWGTKVEEWSEFSENWVEPNSVILGAISRNLKLCLQKKTRKELGRRGLFTNQHPPKWMLSWEDYDGPEKAVVDAGIRKLKENIGGLSSFLKSRGISFTLVVYPYPFHVLEEKPIYATERIWSSWCAENGVDFIDLFPEFVVPGRGKELMEKYYLPDDCHWNAAGHWRVAETLLKNRDKILPNGATAAKSVTPH